VPLFHKRFKFFLQFHDSGAISHFLDISHINFFDKIPFLVYALFLVSFAQYKANFFLFCPLILQIIENLLDFRNLIVAFQLFHLFLYLFFLL